MVKLLYFYCIASSQDKGPQGAHSHNLVGDYGRLFGHGCGGGKPIQ